MPSCSPSSPRAQQRRRSWALLQLRGRFAFYGHLCSEELRWHGGEATLGPREGEEKHPKPSWLPVLRGLLEKLSTNSPLTRPSCAQGAEGNPPNNPGSPTRCPRPCPAPEENTPDHQKESQQPLGIFLFVCCISYIIQFHILIGSASIEQLTLKSFNTSETAMVI